MFNRRRAFTLIELLVVVAIIAMLVSILLPSLSAARRQARACVCLANLKRLGTGVAFYLDDNREVFPPFRLKNGDPGDSDAYVNQWGRKKPRWQWFVDADAVGPVIDPEPFADEIDSSGGFGDGSIGSGGQSGRTMTNKYFLCPSLASEHESDVRNGAYGYNYQYLGNSRRDGNDDQWDNFAVPLGHIRSSAGTVLIADSRGADPVHGKHSYTLDPPRLAVERNAARFGPGADDLSPGADERFAYSPVEMRHGQYGNVVFVDSHAEPMSLRDLGYRRDERGFATPVFDPADGAESASNRLWSGAGREPVDVLR